MPEAVYTPKEVAEMLKVNERTVRRWIRAGRLPAVRFGRQLRISAEALQKFGQPPVIGDHMDWLAKCRRTRGAMPLSADSGELLQQIRLERAKH